MVLRRTKKELDLVWIDVANPMISLLINQLDFRLEFDLVLVTTWKSWDLVDELERILRWSSIFEEFDFSSFIRLLLQAEQPKGKNVGLIDDLKKGNGIDSDPASRGVQKSNNRTKIENNVKTEPQILLDSIIGLTPPSCRFDSSLGMITFNQK